MIGLTRLNGRPIVINAELIETVEATPDTVIALITGKKLVVRESPQNVVELVVHYRRDTVPGPVPPAFPAEQAAQQSLIHHHED